jgi:hypothetical protein
LGLGLMTGGYWIAPRGMGGSDTRTRFLERSRRRYTGSDMPHPVAWVPFGRKTSASLRSLSIL